MFICKQETKRPDGTSDEYTLEVDSHEWDNFTEEYRQTALGAGETFDRVNDDEFISVGRNGNTFHFTKTFESI